MKNRTLFILLFLVTISCQKKVNFSKHLKNVYSDKGEDGVLEKIFSVVKPEHKYVVDIGANDGVWRNNSRNLIEKYGWGGLLIEGNKKKFKQLQENSKRFKKVKTVHKWVYPGNIEQIFELNSVPTNFDLLKIDIDSNDYYIWKVIHQYRPKVVLIEFNPFIKPPLKRVIKYHPFNYWDGDTYFGASLQALVELGEKKGYKLLYCPPGSINAFFIDKNYYSRFGISDNSTTTLFRPDPWSYTEHTFHPPVFEEESQNSIHEVYEKYRGKDLPPLKGYLSYPSGKIKKEYIDLSK